MLSRQISAVQFFGSLDFVEAADGQACGGVVELVGVFFGDAGDFEQRVAEGVEGFPGFGFRGLDHEVFFYREGEVDGGGVEAAVEEGLDDIKTKRRGEFSDSTCRLRKK